MNAYALKNILAGPIPLARDDSYFDEIVNLRGILRLKIRIAVSKPIESKQRESWVYINFGIISRATRVAMVSAGRGTRP